MFGHPGKEHVQKSPAAVVAAVAYSVPDSSYSQGIWKERFVEMCPILCYSFSLVLERLFSRGEQTKVSKVSYGPLRQAKLKGSTFFISSYTLLHQRCLSAPKTCIEYSSHGSSSPVSGPLVGWPQALARKLLLYLLLPLRFLISPTGQVQPGAKGKGGPSEPRNLCK